MALHYFALEIVGGRVRAVHPFTCAVDAEEGARLLGRLSVGAVAVQQWIDPVTGEADEPDVLTVVGKIGPISEALAAG